MLVFTAILTVPHAIVQTMSAGSRPVQDLQIFTENLARFSRETGSYRENVAKGNSAEIENITVSDRISIGIENMEGSVVTRVQKEDAEDTGEEGAIRAMAELKTRSSTIR
jgi:hypothetical protein